MNKHKKFIEALETIAPKGLIVDEDSIYCYFVKYRSTPFIQIICNVDTQEDGRGWREFRIEKVDEQEVVFRRYSEYVSVKIDDCPPSIKCFALLIYLNRYIEKMKIALKEGGFIHQEDFMKISNVFDIIGYVNGSNNFARGVKYDDLVAIRRQFKENEIDAKLLFSWIEALKRKLQQEVEQIIKKKELETAKKKAERIKVKRERMKSSIENANKLLLSLNRETLTYSEKNLEEVYEVAIRYLMGLNILTLKNISKELGSNKSFFA